MKRSTRRLFPPSSTNAADANGATTMGMGQKGGGQSAIGILWPVDSMSLEIYPEAKSCSTTKFFPTFVFYIFQKEKRLFFSQR